MRFDASAYSARERKMIDKLVEACRLLDDVYWRQSDLTGLALYKSTRDDHLKRLLMIMGSRWDLLDENRPFVGDEPMPPGHELYPKGVTRAQIEQYVAQHPAEKAAIYDSYSVVKWQSGRLVAVPYHVEYKAFLEEMAKDLREAAALSERPGFRQFPAAAGRCPALGQLLPQRLGVAGPERPQVRRDFRALRNLSGRPAGREDVLRRFGSDPQRRGEPQTGGLPEAMCREIQDALPLPAADRPSKRGHLTPMEVMDAPYRAGDLRHGYQAVADNLPNDPRIHQEKGTKKIFFKNFMDARVSYVILPLAQKLMPPDQAAKATGEGYMAGTLLHEISHGLGPAFARRNGKQVDIREAIGPAYSGLEEAKADVVGMFGLKWLVDHGAMAKSNLEEYYASYVAGIFRTLRFGTGEAHGRAEMMEFNYLLDNHALRFGGGRYTVDYARMPNVLAQLARELLEMEATGDRARAETWFTRYDRMPADLTQALAGTREIPVDIDPIFSFKDDVR